ncbi:hypothetical protein RDI58_012869 [Solanum bulbocastanum]|jgi:septation ring formation regulator EzrA
MLTKS